VSEVAAEAAQLSLPRVAPVPIPFSLGIGPIKPPPLLPPTDRQELFVSSLAFVTFMLFLTFPLCPLAFLLTLTLMALVFLFTLTLVPLSSLSISLHVQLQRPNTDAHHNR